MSQCTWMNLVHSTYPINSSIIWTYLSHLKPSLSISDIQILLQCFKIFSYVSLHYMNNSMKAHTLVDWVDNKIRILSLPTQASPKLRTSQYMASLLCTGMEWGTYQILFSGRCQSCPLLDWLSLSLHKTEDTKGKHLQGAPHWSFLDDSLMSRVVSWDTPQWRAVEEKYLKKNYERACC